MSAPVLITAGGTGGHVFPALAVAEQLQALGLPVVWLGTRRGLEARLVPTAGIPIEWLEVSGLRGHGLGRLLGAPLMLLRAVRQALAILRRLRPRLVLGMGGFVSGPGGVAARWLGIPLVVHEQNAIAGLTNRWLARLATRVLEAVPGTFPAARRAQAVGNPVRAEIAALAPPGERLAGHSSPGRLLVLGGSQGAQALNDVVPAALARLPAGQRPAVWHQTGVSLHAKTAAAYQATGLSARVEPFIEAMAEAYGWADLVLCRAGALTVAELAAAGVAALLVPFPYAVDDHQTANARFLVAVGAARLLPQSELTAPRLAALLAELFAEREQLRTMAEAARTQARPEAAVTVAQICLHEARA